MKYGEFLKMFEQKAKKMKISEICLELGLDRNAVNYLRHMGKVRPLDEMTQKLKSRLK